MRILICSFTYPPNTSGQSVFTRNLAEGMAQLGHEVVVLLPASDRFNDEKGPSGLKIETVPGVELPFIHEELVVAYGYGKVIRQLLDDFKPEIVHVQDPSPMSKAVVQEAKKRGITVLATHHTGPDIGAPFFSKYPKPLREGIKMIGWHYIIDYLEEADVVIVPSRTSQKMLQDKGLEATIKPISCGVRLEDFHPDPSQNRDAVREHYGLDKEKILVLYVGRLDIEKRVQDLVEAMPLLERKDVQLVLVGGGSIEKELHKYVEENKLQERVQFLGHIQHEKLPELINAVDIFIMPGDVESLSIATLEAMACGKPVLAANAMALPELVTDNVNGFLFHAENPADIACRIEDLTNRRSQWEKMGQESLERVRKHDIFYVLNAYEKVYEEALRKTEADEATKAAAKRSKKSSNAE
jgi:1,2-diacylglycerol 3-alpha-glucosyltransferase